MTLLSPLAFATALALGLAGLAGLYLLKLRRRPVRVSASWLWTDEKADLQVNVPFRWLRASSLLFLHMLIVVLLALAIGRPAIQGGLGPSGRLVLVIDRSASMAASDGVTGGSRLDAARDTARRLVDEAFAGGRSAEITVVGFASSPEVLVAPTRSRQRVLAAIRGIDVLDEPGDPEAAARLIAAITEPGRAQTEGEAADPPAVVLLTDGNNFSDSGLVIPGVRGTFEPVVAPNAPRENLGIAALSVARDYERPSLVRVFVRLVNASGAPASAPVTVLVNGETVAREAVTVPPRSAANADTAGAGQAGRQQPPQRDDPAERVGQAVLTFAFERVAGGVIRVAIDRDDALAADNTAFAVLEAARAPRVALVVPAGAQPDPFLLEVLRELRLASLEVIAAEQLLPRSASDQASVFDLLVFDRVALDGWPALPALVFGPPPAPIAAFAGDTEPGDVPDAAAPGPAAGARLVGEQTGVVRWDRDAPSLSYVSLDEVIVATPYRFRVDAQGAVSARGGQAGRPGRPLEVLADGAAGPLMVRAGGREPVIVVAFVLGQSNWPVTFGFPIFVANAVDTLFAGAEQGGGGRVAATTDAQRVAAAAGRNRVDVRGPVDRSAPVGEEGFAELGRLGRVGVYEVEGAADAGRVLTASLLSEQESSLAFRTRGVVGGGTPEAAGAGGQAERRREVWQWFIAAVLVLSCLEWVLFAWRMRV